MEAASLSAIDGWSAWTAAETGASLFALRQSLLAAANQAIETPTEDGEGDEQRPQSRHAMLTAARESADAGNPHRMTVRQLLSMWGAKGRGHRVVDRVAADLENYSLETRPDFRKVSIHSMVELIGQPTAPDDVSEQPTVVEAPATVDDLDVGLTLGNVPSALSGVTFVKSEDTLATAMTTMRLNDYSQLAVLPSPRTLKGAVTWRSIAKALAHSPEATLSDAIEPAADHPFDRDLVDVLAELYANDFVFVRNSTAEVAGIVTAADVVRLYGETATPFFIIGEIDHLLRSFVADEWTVEQVIEVCDPEQARGIESHDDPTFGDYQRMLEEPGRFSSLGWPLDRATFIHRLNEVREMRNSVAHFEPDPLDPDDVASLRHFLDLLRDIRGRSR